MYNFKLLKRYTLYAEIIEGVGGRRPNAEAKIELFSNSGLGPCWQTRSMLANWAHIGQRRTELYIDLPLMIYLNPAIWKKDIPLFEKSLIFLGLDFFCKRDRQSTIEFNIDPEVLFIYRLIIRKSGFLE
jgi:hypothetical protein